MSQPIDSAGSIGPGVFSSGSTTVVTPAGQTVPQNSVFIQGEIVEGKITGLQDGQVTGVFKGVSLQAETEIPLKVGQSILVEVVESRPGKVHLRILEPQEASGAGIPKDSQAAMLKAMDLQVTQQTRSALSAVMAAGLPLSREAVDFVANAGSLFQADGPKAAALLFALGLPADSTSMALATGAMADPVALSFLLGNAMGKLLRQVKESKDPEVINTIVIAISAMSGRGGAWNADAGKFRNQLLSHLIKMSEKFSDHSGTSAGKSTIPRMTAEESSISSSVRQVLYSMDALSLASRNSLTDYFFGFPFFEEGRVRHFLMTIKGSGGSEKRIDPKNTSVLLDLDLSAIGRIRAGLYISGGVISVKFLTQDDETASAMVNDFPALAEALREHTKYAPGSMTASVASEAAPKEIAGARTPGDPLAGCDEKPRVDVEA